MFLKFFGLDAQPFGVTPDPRFLYMSPAHEEAFASLVYGIETGRGFVALIAAPGMGKTTVLMRLMERIKDSARTAFLFQTHLQTEEFLKSLLTDLGIEPKSRSLSELQREFSDVLIAEARSGRRVVVAIDEAQNLDDATLEMVRLLSNFETPEAKLLQILLVGQKELADKLARPNLEQLRQRISIIAHFPPFQPNEVAKYIDHRMGVAGYKGKPIFTPAALGLIAARSGGIPRNINNLCFHALSLAFAKNQRVVDETTLQEVLSDLNLRLIGNEQGESLNSSGVSFGAGSADVAAHSAPRTVPSPPPPKIRKPAGTLSIDSPLDSIDLTSGRSKGSSLRARTPRRASFSLALVVIVLAAVVWARPSLMGRLESQIGPWLGTSGEAAPKLVQQYSHNPADLPASSPQTDSNTEPLASPKSAAPPAPDSDATKASADPAPEATNAPSHREAPREDVLAANIPQAPASHGNRSRRKPALDDLGAFGDQEHVVVESTEGGARISINGHSSPEWVTPHIFSLVHGVYNVMVTKDGYKPWTRQIRVESGPRKWLEAALVVNRGNGILNVVTEPAGLQVFVDGKAYGPSRIETELPVGWHVCEVITGRGDPPLVIKFHLESGEILTKRIRIPALLPAPSGDAQLQPLIWGRARLGAEEGGQR